MPSFDFYALIPELKAWGDLNGHPYTPEDYLGGVGSFEHSIAYSTLFWPEMTEHDGCVFVRTKDIDQAIYESWLQECDGDRSKVEAVMNHIHLADLFANADPTPEQLEFLGEQLQQMWLAKAKLDLPDRNVETELFHQEDYGLRGYQLTIYWEDHGDA